TQRMSDLLGHVGAWAPKAEQVATAEFLDDAEGFRAFRLEMHRRLRERLELLYRGLMALRARGLPVEAVAPEGTLYLSARFDLFGRSVEAASCARTKTSGGCCSRARAWRSFRFRRSAWSAKTAGSGSRWAPCRLERSTRGS